MARTAPVPNIPAIPGMNPGVFVMGGGGGQGGSGGKGGNGKGGKQGGEGENGGENPEGGGQSANDCGQGSQGKCTNCGNGVVAGDPVDAATGRVLTVPTLDLALDGPLNLEWRRTYNSNARELDAGMGHGWGFTVSWSLEVRRRDAIVHKPDGKSVLFDVPKVAGDVTRSTGGWRLLRTSTGYELDTLDDFRHVFAASPVDPARHLLQAVIDTNGNTIALERDARGALVAVIDAAGRRVRTLPTPEGRVGGLEVVDPLTGAVARFASYTYDARGDLVTVRRPGGWVEDFAYDDEHRMVLHRRPDGLRIHHVYDRAGRCVETWGDREGGVEPALDPEAPDVLADGHTKAKGIHHVVIRFIDDGWVEIVDARRVQRIAPTPEGGLATGATGPMVTSREHDAAGRVIARVDPLGKETRYELDENGRRLATTTPMGRTRRHVRDDRGRIVETIAPSGATTTFSYDAANNLVAVRDPRGFEERFDRDPRGLITAIVDKNGDQTRFRYDAHGNCVEVHTPLGGVWQQTFDGLGRITSSVDPAGGVASWQRDDAGRVIAATKPGGGVERFGWDGAWNLLTRVDPDGRATQREVAGASWFISERLASGDTFSWRYDREGFLLRAIDEKGAEWRFEWNAQLTLAAERTFDGRRVRYQYDLANRCTLSEDQAGRRQELAWDDDDDLVGATYDDGTALTFERDVEGRVAVATAPDAETRFDRDATGNVIRETHVIAGESFVVETARDAMGQVVRLGTSLGHAEEIARGPMELRARTTLAGGLTLEHHRDVHGLETRRVIGRAAIESSFGPQGWLERRRVTRPGDEARTSAGEPEWIGAARADAIDTRYGFSASGDILHRDDPQRGGVRYQYDAAKRLTEVERTKGTRESFRYDAAGNHYPVFPHAEDREYAVGNRLVRRGLDTWEYDAHGQLARKVVGDPAGGPPAVWRYRWSSRGLLDAVEVPGGDRVDFLYDAFARRVRKRLVKVVDGVPQVAADTRYVWSGPRVIHEVRRVSGDPATVVRTTAWEDRGSAPMAQREERIDATGRSTGAWQMFVLDANDTPDALVDERGSPLAVFDRHVWGRTRTLPGATATTSIRFPGQTEDEETGLHYNRMRYYDPDAGRYIAPDLVGIDEAAPNVYRYCVNPVSWADPLGLHAVNNVSLTFADGTSPDPPTSTNAAGQPGNFHSGYSSKYPWKSDPHCQALAANGETGKAYWESHTERKAMRWADEQANATDPPRSLAGAKLKMRGTKAPCNTCNAAMREWTKNGATIDYSWDDEKGLSGSRTYSGGLGSGSPRRPYSDRTD